MFLQPYYSRQGNHIAISAAQGSDFAKQVADDFNPLHNEDNRRFCVPGDLIFSLALHRYGVYRHMEFAFTGMVGGDVPLQFPDEVDEGVLAVKNPQDKSVVEMTFSGDSRQDPAFSEAVIREYVAFSGHNFPHILVPLLAEQGVMINPERPLVMYERMALSFEQLDFDQPKLVFAGANLDVSGKRGDVQLNFDITSAGDVVGRGFKKLVIGGLQPYSEAAMAEVISGYEESKRAYNKP